MLYHFVRLWWNGSATFTMNDIFEHLCWHILSEALKYLLPSPSQCFVILFTKVFFLRSNTGFWAVILFFKAYRVSAQDDGRSNHIDTVKIKKSWIYARGQLPKIREKKNYQLPLRTGICQSLPVYPHLGIYLSPLVKVVFEFNFSNLSDSKHSIL